MTIIDLHLANGSLWDSQEAGEASERFEEINSSLIEVIPLAMSYGDRELARGLVDLLGTTMDIQESLRDAAVAKRDRQWAPADKPSPRTFTV